MNHSRTDIRRRAVNLLESAGIRREPVSLRDVVSALNLAVVQTEREPFSCEAALEPPGDGQRIAPHGSSSRRRRRLTIAHEIGHFVLHPARLAPEGRGAVDEALTDEEREADQFAAELLMPEHLVREAVHEQGGDEARLADRFDVSRQAMRARLRGLGLAGHHAHRARSHRPY